MQDEKKSKGRKKKGKSSLLIHLRLYIYTRTHSLFRFYYFSFFLMEYEVHMRYCRLAETGLLKHIIEGSEGRTRSTRS